MKGRALRFVSSGDEDLQGGSRTAMRRLWGESSSTSAREASSRKRMFNDRNGLTLLPNLSVTG